MKRTIRPSNAPNITTSANTHLNFECSAKTRLQKYAAHPNTTIATLVQVANTEPQPTSG